MASKLNRAISSLRFPAKPRKPRTSPVVCRVWWSYSKLAGRRKLRWVKIKEVGDTEFLLEEQVDRFRFTDENERVRGEKGEVSQAEPLLLGITKASLSTDSFISAASFQETTRVLTEAAISGRVDYLRGLKEN